MCRCRLIDPEAVTPLVLDQIVDAYIDAIEPFSRLHQCKRQLSDLELGGSRPLGQSGDSDTSRPSRERRERAPGDPDCGRSRLGRDVSLSPD
jgi:hypothetical protein